MAPETLTLDEALNLLTLPRSLGVDPADGEEVVAANGRYGPFIRKGESTRSLESEEQLFTLGLDEALALLAQPKARGRRTAATPLRDLGPDPASGKATDGAQRAVRALRDRRRDERQPADGR